MSSLIYKQKMVNLIYYKLKLENKQTQFDTKHAQSLKAFKFKREGLRQGRAQGGGWWSNRP